MSGLDVAVLGAGGIIARAIVRDLADSEEVARLRLLDLDAVRVKEVAASQGGGKASAAHVDARSSLAPSLDGCDVLVNAASYRVNLDAMRAALKAGCHYIDLGGLYWMTGRQLELDADFVRADLLAILGMGASPGKTNVMAVRAARELGTTRVREIHVSAAGRDPAPMPPNGSALRVPYALQTLVDEVTLKPVMLVDGRPTEIVPLRSGGAVEFPDPIGSDQTILTLHSELRTFAGSFGCEQASFRLSLSPDLLTQLRRLVGAPRVEIAAAAARALPPSEETIAGHVVEASDDGRTVRVSALTVPAREWRLGGGIVSTAAPAAAAVRLLARGRIAARGVRPPERCIDPDELFPELERRGCTFSIEAREAVSG
jgi:saccharopine dehydrogenase (NAD+, L-lysine-forming)